MSLNKKDINIIEVILKEPISVSELSKEFNSSERNIRYILDNLNFYLLKILGKEIIKMEKKLTLSITKDEFSFFLNTIYKKHYVLQHEERVQYILLMFLFLKNVKLSFIEENLNITRATLKKDMFYLSKDLEEHSLFFTFYKNKFFISGNEKKLRHLMTLKFLEYFEISDKELKDDKIISFYPKNTTFKNSRIEINFFIESIDCSKSLLINQAITEIEKAFNYKFSSEFKLLILVFLLISKKRIDEGHIINKKNNFNFLVNTQQFIEVSSCLSSVIPQDYTYEMAHITEYFISGGVPTNTLEFNDIMTKFIYELLIYVTNKLKQEFQLELLKAELTSYLIPAIYRLKNNFSLGSIGEKNELYYIVDEFCSNNNLLPERLTSNEIYFISTLIGFYLEKNSKQLVNLEALLKIIEKNSSQFNKEQFIKDLKCDFDSIFTF